MRFKQDDHHYDRTLDTEWLDQSWCAAWENCVYSQTSPTIQYPQQQHTTVQQKQKERRVVYRHVMDDIITLRSEEAQDSRSHVRPCVSSAFSPLMDGWMDGTLEKSKTSMDEWYVGKYWKCLSACVLSFLSLYMCPRAPFNCLTFLSSRNNQS
jgi:hypothetical protein